MSVSSQHNFGSLGMPIPSWFLSLSSSPACTARLNPRLQWHSWCTASWEGACFAPSWETSCWWSPQPLTTGCSTVCRAASPTRDYGGTACPASATCKRTALVGETRLCTSSVCPQVCFPLWGEKNFKHMLLSMYYFTNQSFCRRRPLLYQCSREIWTCIFT